MSHPIQHHLSSSNNPRNNQPGFYGQPESGYPQIIPPQPASQPVQYVPDKRQASAFQPVIQLQGGDGVSLLGATQQYKVPNQAYNQINPSFLEQQRKISPTLLPVLTRHHELLESAHSRAVERTPSLTSGQTPSRPLMKSLERTERPFADIIAPNSLTYQVFKNSLTYQVLKIVLLTRFLIFLNIFSCI